jgi:group I intron endonuclease
MMEKKHFIYKTTNLLNGRFYIGMHTGYPDDGYLGSGKRIKAEIKKYGKENFKREILETLPTRNALELREEEIVDDMLLQDLLCLNLKNGGEGGGKFWSEEHQLKASSAGGKVAGKIYATNLTFEEQSRRSRLSIANGRSTATFVGKKHSEETKQKMRKSKNVAEKNSQFGTCWVSKDSKPIKIKKEQLDEYLANGYSRGRK